MNALSKEQIDDLLDNVLHVKKRNGWRGDKQQFTCPVHHESNPSCGINVSFTPENKPFEQIQVFHCFSCNAGGTIPKLLAQSLPDKFKTLKSAYEFIEKRYGILYEYSYDPKLKLVVMRFEDAVYYQSPLRQAVDHQKLAVFKSGKETYKYFFDRGFDKYDVKKFKIGRDINEETVTIPIFYEDGVLAGIIGRYISKDRPSNFRYKVYGDFKRSLLLYPLNHLLVEEGTIILVESMLDVIMMHKWGYYNVLATMGVGFSKTQADLVAERCNSVILMFDSDERGQSAVTVAEQKLKGRVNVLLPTYFPEHGKDPSEWGKEETDKVVASASLKGSNIPRFD